MWNTYCIVALLPFRQASNMTFIQCLLSGGQGCSRMGEEVLRQPNGKSHNPPSRLCISQPVEAGHWNLCIPSEKCVWVCDSTTNWSTARQSKCHLEVFPSSSFEKVQKLILHEDHSPLQQNMTSNLRSWTLESASSPQRTWTWSCAKPWRTKWCSRYSLTCYWPFHELDFQLDSCTEYRTTTTSTLSPRSGHHTSTSTSLTPLPLLLLLLLHLSPQDQWQWLKDRFMKNCKWWEKVKKSYAAVFRTQLKGTELQVKNWVMLTYWLRVLVTNPLNINISFVIYW